MKIVPPFHWPKALQVTWKYLPTNNILLMRKRNHPFLIPAIALALREKWLIASLPEDIHYKTNLAITKYGDLSVSHRSIICRSRIECSPPTNHHILLNLVQ